MSQANPRNQGIRWGWIILGLAAVFVVIVFLTKSSEESLQYYMTVGEYLDHQGKFDGKKVKIAGKVKVGTYVAQKDLHQFVVEDLGRDIYVNYKGLVPDTFKEGSEVVVEGLGSAQAHFEAKGLMAKCASKYEVGGLPPLEKMRGKSVY